MLEHELSTIFIHFNNQQITEVLCQADIQKIGYLCILDQWSERNRHFKTSSCAVKNCTEHF